MEDPGSPTSMVSLADRSQECKVVIGKGVSSRTTLATDQRKRPRRIRALMYREGYDASGVSGILEDVPSIYRLTSIGRKRRRSVVFVSSHFDCGLTHIR